MRTTHKRHLVMRKFYLFIYLFVQILIVKDFNTCKLYLKQSIFAPDILKDCSNDLKVLNIFFFLNFP